jgi:hypothetical protein
MPQVERSEITLPIKREDFGPGRAGDMDYSLMLFKPPCEAFIDEEKNLCGKPAIKILDFDTATTTEQLPVCSDVCWSKAEQLIFSDEIKRGKTPRIGINGWGRGRMLDGVTS